MAPRRRRRVPTSKPTDGLVRTRCSAGPACGPFACHDAQLADAFAQSAGRLRLSIQDRRAFTLAADPQNREGNNIRLLTGDVGHDVVFVADRRGEFGRYVPYATQLSRPIIGSVGLTSDSWHWAFERDGATQVSSRFDKLTGRKMEAMDWDVWIGVKSLITVAVTVPQADPGRLRAFLVSDQMKLDGFKGFRPSNQ